MKLGIALSGGGIRGAAHIGVLKALEENGIKPDLISGASAGSIVSGLYASGMDTKAIEEFALETQKKAEKIPIYRLLNQVNKVGSQKFTIDGLLPANRIEKTFLNYTKKININKVKIPLAISTVNINTGSIVMFVNDKAQINIFDKNKMVIYVDDGVLGEIIRASISIPVLFKPKFINGMRLVDGGLVENLPIDVLKQMGATKVIAVNLGYSGQTKTEVNNILEIAFQTIDIMSYHITKLKSEKADIILNPKIFNVKLTEFNRIKECIERGYQFTLENMHLIKRAISR